MSKKKGKSAKRQAEHSKKARKMKARKLHSDGQFQSATLLGLRDQIQELQRRFDFIFERRVVVVSYEGPAMHEPVVMSGQWTDDFVFDEVTSFIESVDV